MGWSTFILLGWFDGPIFEDQDILGMVLLFYFDVDLPIALFFSIFWDLGLKKMVDRWVEKEGWMKAGRAFAEKR